MLTPLIWFSTPNGHDAKMHILAIAAMAAKRTLTRSIRNNYGPLELVPNYRPPLPGSPEEWAQFRSRAFASQFLRYATHLSSGRVQPNKINKALNLFPDRPDPTILFRKR